jgi:dolichyl-phosphate-mannose--protein O-mannosyl transferase
VVRRCVALSLLIVAIDSNDSSAAEPPAPRVVKPLSFFWKFFEMQILMLQHNAGLTDSHPYASTAINWPFLLSGISFWTGKPETGQQVYMIGNVVGWWFSVMSLSVFVGVLGADQLARQRGVYPIPDGWRVFLYLFPFTELMSHPHRYPQPPVQLYRLLCRRLVGALSPIFHDGPSNLSVYSCLRFWNAFILN